MVLVVSTISLGDEIVIGGVRGKSNAGAILLCEEALSGAEGSPEIVRDRLANAPQVVVVTFSSARHAQDYITANSKKNIFLGFWCNMNQTLEERNAYKVNVQRLFKIKRAILEKTKIDAKEIVVNKTEKKVFMIEGHNLREMEEMKGKRNIIWAADIQTSIIERYDELTS